MPDLKTTYNILKKGGAKIGTINDFSKAMSNEDFSKNVYNSLTKNETINESYDDFKSSIFTSDRITGEKLPTIDEVEERKKREEQSKEAVPKDDYLVQRIGDKPEPKQEFPKTTKIPLGSKIVQNIPEEDYLRQRIDKTVTNKKKKEYLLDPNPHNLEETFHLTTLGIDDMIKLRVANDRELKREEIRDLLGLDNSWWDKKVLRNTQAKVLNDPDKIYTLVDQRVKDNPNLITKNIDEATSLLYGINPKLYKSPEEKSIRQKREELYDRGKYANEAKMDLEMLRDINNAEIKDEKNFTLYANKFLQSNAKVRGYKNPALSVVDLFTTPIDLQEKKIVQTYMDYISKVKPMEYDLLKKEIFNNLFKSENAERKIIQNAIDLNKKTLEIGLTTAKEKGYLPQYKRNTNKKREFINIANELKTITDKLNGMNQDPSNPEYIRLTNQYNEKFKQYDNLKKNIEENDNNAYNKVTNEFVEDLITQYDKVLNFEKKAFYNENKSLFTEEARKRKNYTEAVDRLTELKNSNSIIDNILGQYEIASKEMVNSVVKYLTGTLSLGVSLGGMLEKALSSDKQGVEYKTGRWQEEIDKFSKSLQFDLPESQLVDKDNNIQWENAYPALVRTGTDMGLLILGGRTGSIKKLGLSENVANNIGLVISGTAFEFKGQYDEAIKNGLSPIEASKKAFNTALAIGALELVNPNPEILTGFKYTNKAVKDLIKDKHWIKSTTHYLSRLNKETAGEVIQELSQSQTEYEINKLYNDIYGKNKFQEEFAPGEMKETILLTAATTMLLHSGTQTANNIGPGNYNQKMYDFALLESVKTDKDFLNTKKELFDLKNDSKISENKYEQIINDLTHQRQAQIRSDMYKRSDFIPTPELKRLLRLESINNAAREKDKDNIVLKEKEKQIKGAIEAEIHKSTAEYIINDKKVDQKEFLNKLNDNNTLNELANNNISMKVYGDKIMSKVLNQRYQTAKRLKSLGIKGIVSPAEESNIQGLNIIRGEIDNQIRESDVSGEQTRINIANSEEIISNAVDELSESEFGQLIQEKTNLESELANIDISDNIQRGRILDRIKEIEKLTGPILRSKEKKEKVRQEKLTEKKKIQDEQQRQEFVAPETKVKPEGEQQQIIEEEIKSQKQSEINKQFEGKLVYGSPAIGKTFMVKNKKNPNWVDADDLLRTELKEAGVNLSLGTGKAIKSLYRTKRKVLAEEIYKKVEKQIDNLLMEGKTVFTGTKRFMLKADIAIVKEKPDQQYLKEAMERPEGQIPMREIQELLKTEKETVGDLPKTITLKEGQHISDVFEGNIPLTEGIKDTLKKQSDKLEALKVKKEAAINSNNKEAQEKVLNEENKVREQTQKELNKENAKESISLNEFSRKNEPVPTITTQGVIERQKFCK